MNRICRKAPYTIDRWNTGGNVMCDVVMNFDASERLIILSESHIGVYASNQDWEDGEQPIVLATGPEIACDDWPESYIKKVETYGDRLTVRHVDGFEVEIVLQVLPDLAEVLDAAQAAFWDVICSKYPDAKTGDFPPCATFAFNEACAEAAQIWLGFNSPAYNAQGDKEAGL